MRYIVSLLVLCSFLSPVYKILAAPDYTGTVEVQVSPKDDQTVSVKFPMAICNNGDSACSFAWYVDFWATYPCACSVHPMECNQAPTITWQNTIDFPDLAASYCVNIDISVDLPPSSTPHNFLLFIDSLESCAESNEDNNRICGSYVADIKKQGPDLVLKQCDVGPDPEYPAGVKFSAVVKNQGDAETVGPTSVDFFLNVTPGQPEELKNSTGDAFAIVPKKLQPGEEFAVSASLSDVPSGQYYPGYIVNGFNETDETDYNNNACWPGLYEHVAVDIKPDLLISEFSAEVVGDKVEYKGKVKNSGYLNIESQEEFKICIYYDLPSAPGFCEVPDIEAGEGWIKAVHDGLGIDEELEFGYKKKAENGVYNVWARVDCDCQILELDEKNNDAKQLLEVEIPGPDIELDGCYVELQYAGDNTMVKYTTVLKNVGTDPITKTIALDLFYDADHPPTKEELLEGVQYQGQYLPYEHELQPKESVPIEFLWKDPKPGTYTSWILADPLDEIFETSESNNVAGPCFVEVPPPPQGPNLAISEFTAKVTGTTITYHIRITNNGDQDITKKFRIDLFTDRETPPQLSEYGDKSQTVKGLAAGQSINWDETWDKAPDGEYYSYLIVDTENVVEESTEADNIAGPRISTVCSTCGECPNNEYFSSPCVCGNETVPAGYCCNGEWYAVACPEPSQQEPEFIEYDAGPPVEFSGGTKFKRGADCSCTVGTSNNVEPYGLEHLLIIVALCGLLLLWKQKSKAGAELSDKLRRPAMNQQI